MRKIRDVLRLTASGMSSRKVAASLSVGGTTVIDCLQRARAVGIAWPLAEDITDEVLEARLYDDGRTGIIVSIVVAGSPFSSRPTSS